MARDRCCRHCPGYSGARTTQSKGRAIILRKADSSMPHDDGVAKVLIGYARVSKADGSQSLDLQIDALKNASVELKQVYSDQALGKKDERPGLEACLKALRDGDVLVVW